MTTNETRYLVRRFYRDEDPRSGDVVRRGLTLEEAQAHCARDDTHELDANDQIVWFDGYDIETGS